ncbi:MAG TPA: TetR/AcrR family transcriptional regulator [Pseudonocardiaceae bacterium]|nr:TetR/AcrR family transcriptional regulator [Pseudonocardiaceae bacterium]
MTGSTDTIGHEPIAPIRRTQAQRSERTRELLLTATIECLLELGYTGTTVQEVCRRAGLSRGAQQHHFATKAELMTHALEYLVSKLSDQVRDSVRDLADDPDRVAKAIDLLWDSYSGDLSTAALELWVAARTDPELRATLLPMDRALGRATRALYRELGWRAGDDGITAVPAERLDTLFWLTVNLTRGLALDVMIGGDPARRAEILAEWKRIASNVLS